MQSSRKFLIVAMLTLTGCLGLFSARPAGSQENTDSGDQVGTPTPTPIPSPTPTPIQPTNLHQWGAVTLFHGLPSNRVRAIAQGPDGTMWFGTDAGLARYDGRRTQAVTAESLPGGKVLALKYDEAGVLWIGTEVGAVRLVGTSFQPVPDTAGKTVTAILIPSKDRAILATAEGLIFECQTKSNGEVIVARSLADPLHGVDGDKNGPLYLTSLAMTGDRLLVGTRGRGILAIENGTSHELDMKPRAFFVEAITVGPRGTVIVGAKAKNDSSGLFELGEHAHLDQMDTPTGAVVVFARGSRDDLWVGSDGRGAFRVNGAKIDRFTFDGTAGGLRSDHIYSIFIDREDVVWFGTDRGVCRYDPHAPRTENISNDPESNFIRALYESKTGLTLAGTNRGLFTFDANTKTWQRVEQLARNTIYTISEDQNGRVLIGTAGGLFITERMPNSSTELRPANVSPRPGGVDAEGSVRSIVQFKGVTYIASYGRGVERVIGKTVSSVWPAEGSEPQLRQTISLYSDGVTLWIGTVARGVFKFDGDKTVKEPGLDPVSTGAVRSMIADASGRMWFATANGLFSLKDDQLTPVLTGVDARDLTLAVENGTAFDHPVRPVWCATAGAGLVEASFAEGLGPIVTKLDAEQGMPSQNVFKVMPLRDASGMTTILAGTNRGLARFEPARAAPVLAATQVIGRRLYAVEELKTGLNLEYPQNSVIVNVLATSSRTFPEQFQYAFQVRDDHGKIIKQKLSHDPQFALEGLRPGHYRLESVAFSRELVPSIPLKFNLNVAKAPFPWTSTALGILLALALVALWWGYWQNRRIRQTSSELIVANHQLATARMDLANEAEAERRRIARDLHDQTLADLRNLLMLTDRLPVKAVEEGQEVLVPGVLRSEIEAVSTEIRRICEDLSPSALENVGLGAALEWALVNSVTHVSTENRFEFRIECEEDLEEKMHFASGIRMQIYRIA
ncbi:MAG: hypothetical protein QOH96_966, partial [Blastocatellia bacterium]|nr:hypothetical protein [Blastocatellia bacterium]